MGLSIKHRLKFSRIAVIGVIGAILGFIYAALEDGFDPIYPILNGLTSGIMMGTLIGVLELYLFRPYLHRSRFLTLLIIRIMTYMVSVTVIILFVVTLSRSNRDNMGFFEALLSKDSKDYILYGDFMKAELYTFVLSIIVNFGLLVSLKMGRGVLADYLLGLYYKPKEVSRIFTFIQIVNATDVLKKSNIEAYHRFLNEVIFDITLPVLNTRGFIYEYMDNQMIVFWKPSKKWESLFNEYINEIYYTVNSKKDEYMLKYGLVPEFKFGWHEGKVIKGEIGEIKAEIVFQGDILNTTARILEKAISSDSEILISEKIFKRLRKLKLLNIEQLGPMDLKGKEEKLNIYSIR